MATHTILIALALLHLFELLYSHFSLNDHCNWLFSDIYSIFILRSVRVIPFRLFTMWISFLISAWIQRYLEQPLRINEEENNIKNHFSKFLTFFWIFFWICLFLNANASQSCWAVGLNNGKWPSFILTKINFFFVDKIFTWVVKKLWQKLTKNNHFHFLIGLKRRWHN